MKIPMKRLILALTLVFTLLFSISFATANTKNAKSKTSTNTATDAYTFLQTDLDFVISQDNFTKENVAFVNVNAISKESKSVNDYSYIPEAIANTTYNRQSAIVNRQSKKQVNGLNYYRHFNNFTNKLNQKLFLRACLSRASPAA